MFCTKQSWPVSTTVRPFLSSSFRLGAHPLVSSSFDHSTPSFPLSLESESPLEVLSPFSGDGTEERVSEQSLLGESKSCHKGRRRVEDLG